MSKDVFTNKEQLCQSFWQSAKKQKFKAIKIEGGGGQFDPTPPLKASRVNTHIFKTGKLLKVEPVNNPTSAPVIKPEKLLHCLSSVFTITVRAEQWSDDRLVISFCSRKLNVTNLCHCGKFATSLARIICFCFLYLSLKFLKWDALTAERLSLVQLFRYFVEFKREFELFVLFSFRPTTTETDERQSQYFSWLFHGAFGFKVVFECQFFLSINNYTGSYCILLSVFSLLFSAKWDNGHHLWLCCSFLILVFKSLKKIIL